MECLEFLGAPSKLKVAFDQLANKECV